MAFEYRPFVNPYISSMTDLMGQGTEARSRAELSAAEAEAGGQLRLGDLTQQKWSGLGNTLAGGIDDYVTERREAPLREHAALLRAEQLAEIGRGGDERERERLAQELIGRTLAGRPNPEERQPYQPPRFRGIPSAAGPRDEAGNFVRAEPRLEEADPPGTSGAPYHRFDMQALVQEAADGNFLPQMGPGLQILEALNTDTDRRFNEAYDRSKETFNQLLDQSPEELMSGGAQFLEHFSRELGESPQFQGLINALETGDPRAFETAVRRYTETPHTLGEGIDPRLDRIRPYTGIIDKGIPDVVRTPLPTRAYLALRAAQGDVIAQRALEYWPEDQAAPRGSTGSEKEALAFFNRAQIADDTVNSLEDWITGQGKLGQGRLAFAPNVLQSPEGQRYLQAQRAFTEARLRRESGAAIPPHEFESDRQTYFAQPGDTSDTIAQKRQGRAAILSGLAFESGPALREFYGPDYEGIIRKYTGGSVGPPTPGNGPQVGERRTIGGQLGEWDGQGWVAVQ